MSYYERTATTHIDGTPMFTTPEDEAHERAIATAIEHAWRCELRPFGKLSAIDYYALRDGRLAGVIECKSRSHAAGTFATVFLNVRKWLALSLAEVGLGVPAVYVVQFTDGIRWVRVGDVDASRVDIAGCRKIVKGHSDIGPMIHVPIEQMSVLK